jgi:probable addiction module antidote protein
MSIRTTRWDYAVHLKTEEDIQLYLEACMEEADGDSALILHAFGVVARSRPIQFIARSTAQSPPTLPATT